VLERELHSFRIRTSVNLLWSYYRRTSVKQHTAIRCKNIQTRANI